MERVKYFFKRIGASLITLLLITFVVFVVIQLPPGDYVDAVVTQMIIEGETVTEAETEQMRVDYGLDEPFLVQYFSWLGGIVTGDWGTSFEYNISVLDKIGETFGMTITISLLTMTFTYLVSIPIAIYSARHQYTLGDYVVTFIGFIGIAMPSFLLAILLMFGTYKWTGEAIMGLPEFGITNYESFTEWVKSLIIPIVVIGISGTCGTIRSIRAQMLDERQLPYVLALMAKGVSEAVITYKYQMRSVLNPTVSGIGGMIASIFNGSTITAVVLMLPTLGPVMLSALQSQDIYLSGGVLLISAFLVVIGNLISDILLGVLDPRIKLEAKSA